WSSPAASARTSTATCRTSTTRPWLPSARRRSRRGSAATSRRSGRNLERMRITLREVTKRFGAATAVDRVTLEIGDGELFTLLGEPLSNLDAKIRVQVRGEIRALQKDLGITTIYVTHDQEEALSLSDRVAVMRDGRVQQVASPKALYERPANRFVADFVGTNNFIPGVVTERAGAHVLVATALGPVCARPAVELA